MFLISHPTGNVFVRALLEGCERAGLDYRFFTTLAFDPKSPWTRLVPPKLRAELLRRAYPIPRGRCILRPWRELLRLTAGRCGGHPKATGRRSISVDAVYADLDRFVARWIARTKRGAVQTVYGYEDGCRDTFSIARDEGIQCGYELPIAYWQTVQRLLREEAARWPDWKPTLGATSDDPIKLERKTRELELADIVICPSQFVYDSLPSETQAKRVVIAEFGSPTISHSPPREPPGRNQPLRILFAGSFSQRKGLADLFAALKLLHRQDLELVLLGSPILPLAFYRERYPRFSYEKPRPHQGVLDLMATCDILVLPSIVEGRALVQQEAMSSGLPLIVTANAGGEDLIESGQTGFLVPIRQPEAIAERINWFADNRAALPAMAEAAKAKARTYTWERYCSRIFGTIDPQPLLASHE